MIPEKGIEAAWQIYTVGGVVGGVLTKVPGLTACMLAMADPQAARRALGGPTKLSPGSVADVNVTGQKTPHSTLGSGKPARQFDRGTALLVQMEYLPHTSLQQPHAKYSGCTSNSVRMKEY